MDLNVIFTIPSSSLQSPERLKAVALTLIPVPTPASLKITAAYDQGDQTYVRIEYTLTGLTADQAASAALTVMRMEVPC